MTPNEFDQNTVPERIAKGRLAIDGLGPRMNVRPSGHRVLGARRNQSPAHAHGFAPVFTVQHDNAGEAHGRDGLLFARAAEQV